MIKLKDLLYEMSSLNLLIARRVEGRPEKHVQAIIKQYIKDKNVGDFDISGLKLTTLPVLLKNLKIGGNFFCRYNNLDSLVGAPTSVDLDFLCNNNKLTSLVGAPTSVGGDFFCRNSSVKFTEKQVRAVCDVKGNIYV